MIEVCVLGNPPYPMSLKLLFPKRIELIKNFTHPELTQAMKGIQTYEISILIFGKNLVT